LALLIVVIDEAHLVCRGGLHDHSWRVLKMTAYSLGEVEDKLMQTLS
jgi:hypothetical protein